MRRLLIAAMLIFATFALAACFGEAEPPPFVLGIDAHEIHATTVDEFLHVFATQLATYNENAYWLWPGNGVIDQFAVLEDTDRGLFWFFYPDGAFREMPLSEVDELGIMPGGGDEFTGVRDAEGNFILIHLTIDAARLNDRERIARVVHLGTHDPILWLTHEAFHVPEQTKWATHPAEDLPNLDRRPNLENVSARLARNLLQRQLMEALQNPGDEGLILDALATYRRWKTDYPDDFLDAVDTDRMEGTAFYFELISGLVVGYPDIIYDWDGIHRAFEILATYEHFRGIGLVSESYSAGGFAAAILSRLDLGWKEVLMADPDATPLSLLYDHFAGRELPPPASLTQAEIDAVIAQLHEERLRLIDAAKVGIDLFLGLLGDFQGDEALGLVMMIQMSIDELLAKLDGLPEDSTRESYAFIEEVQNRLRELGFAE
ncbi:MAG: hypothetical protein LBE35_06490 [Clostridiales bacterium]|jgi:hypothetical protein|nr:hypothetical protein [Clostridiales bacterium]